MKRIIEEFNDGYAMVATWCKDLTDEQMAALMFVLDNGGFLGVARGIGNMELWPMIETGLNNSIYVINSDGNYELAAIDGRRYFKEKRN